MSILCPSLYLVSRIFNCNVFYPALLHNVLSNFAVSCISLTFRISILKCIGKVQKSKGPEKGWHTCTYLLIWSSCSACINCIQTLNRSSGGVKQNTTTIAQCYSLKVLVYLWKKYQISGWVKLLHLTMYASS